uniref:Kazal-like domain-containing protein n=1 Tax=Rhabditophanes sp. KR3021 TaxID=114890 RepID=A0AC35TIU0_9BILA
MVNLRQQENVYFHEFKRPTEYPLIQSKNNEKGDPGSESLSRQRRNRPEHHKLNKSSHHHRRRRKECPTARKGQHMMMCPSRNERGYDVCISSEQLCNQIPDCPNREDEDSTNCMFYHSTKAQLKHIYNALLLLTESTVSQSDRLEL